MGGDIMTFLVNKHQQRIDSLPKEKRLFEYFGFWMKYGPRYCENCWLLGRERVITSFDIFPSQAHILPKRDNQFPSVSAVLWNHLTLGTTCGCHDRFDRSWSDAVAMPIFDTALERFFLFQARVEEIHKVPDVFLKSELSAKKLFINL